MDEQVSMRINSIWLSHHSNRSARPVQIQRLYRVEQFFYNFLFLVNFFARTLLVFLIFLKKKKKKEVESVFYWWLGIYSHLFLFLNFLSWLWSLSSFCSFSFIFSFYCYFLIFLRPFVISSVCPPSFFFFFLNLSFIFFLVSILYFLYSFLPFWGYSFIVIVNI